METFKQFHQENNIFNCEQKIPFGLCNQKGELNLCELLKLTSDLAGEDFTQRGISRRRLIENNFALLVSRTSFRFFKMPIEQQKVVIRTWEEKFEPLQLVRSYEFRDLNSNELLISGLSTWLLCDYEKHKILPSKLFTLEDTVTYTTEHNLIPPGKIKIPAELTKIGERIIRYTDIDAYGHTNNSRYAAFIIDALDEKYQNLTWKDFRINYSKEAKLGETLELFANFEEEKKIIFVGKSNGNVSFEAELYY